MGALHPTAGGIRPVNPVLQNRLTAYFNSRDSYIAEKVLPSIFGVQKSGTIMSVAAASGFGDINDNLLRAYRGKYHRSIGPQMGSTTFHCEEYGDEAGVDLGMLEDAAEGFDLKVLESKVALENLLIWQERRCADLLFNTSTFTSVTLAGANQWSAATSDPIANIDTAVQSVHSRTGKDPNTIIFGRLPYRTTLKNASLLSYRPTTVDRNMMAPEQLKEILGSVFGIQDVFVGNSLYNSANQGQAASLSYVWGDMVWIGYLDRSEGGAGVALAGGTEVRADASAAIRLVQTDLVSEEYDEPQTRSVIVRHRHKLDELVTSAASGYVINDITA